MPRSVKTWVCEQCKQPFNKVNTGHKYRFCNHRCAALFSRPSRHLLIPDDKPISLRTQYRRRRAEGLTQAVFRFPFNEAFFKTWSDELAWLTGLIWSDGCLIGNGVDICSKDRSLIETIARIIEQPNGVRTKNNGRHWRIMFTSPKVANFFRSIGLTPAKSFTIKWPDIPAEFEHAFVRGLFDGDGSISLSKTRKGQRVADNHLYICGASQFLLPSLVAYMDRYAIKHSITIRSNGFWKVNVLDHKSLTRLYSFFYANEASPRLDRKWIKFKLWMDTPRYAAGGKGGVPRLSSSPSSL